MNKQRMSLLLASFFGCCSLVPCLSSAQTIANKKQIIREARKAYYNLRSEGLAEVQCSVSPNWKAVLADLSKSDPDEAGRVLKTLDNLRFNARLGRDGKVVLIHNDLETQDQQKAEGLHQIYGGIEQNILGLHCDPDAISMSLWSPRSWAHRLPFPCKLSPPRNE